MKEHSIYRAILDTKFFCRDPKSFNCLLGLETFSVEKNDLLVLIKYIQKEDKSLFLHLKSGKFFLRYVDDVNPPYFKKIK